MNKEQFMKELERLLQNIPENEREEALSYYEEYFDDAGVENEQQVLKELGNPDKIAANIRENLPGNMGNQNMGSGYQNTGYQHIGTQNVYTSPVSDKKDKDLPAWAIVLLVIAGIIASPMLIGALGTIGGVLVGILAAVFGIIVGFGVAGIALIVAFCACVVTGISVMFTDVFAGILLCGIGFLLAAIGVLFILATVWICGWALPTFVKWLIKMCKKLFQKEQTESVA